MKWYTKGTIPKSKSYYLKTGLYDMLIFQTMITCLYQIALRLIWFSIMVCRWFLRLFHNGNHSGLFLLPIVIDNKNNCMLTTFQMSHVFTLPYLNSDCVLTVYLKLFLSHFILWNPVFSCIELQIEIDKNIEVFSVK